jgi:hypothetical protein
MTAAPFLLLLALLSPQSKETVPIRVRIINDRDGKPVTDALVSLRWSNDPEKFRNRGLDAKTDRNGIVRFEVPADAKYVRSAEGSGNFRCYSLFTAYPLSQVISNGVVSPYQRDNRCGNDKHFKRVSAQPGEVVLCVHKRSWWDRFLDRTLGNIWE